MSCSGVLPGTFVACGEDPIAYGFCSPECEADFDRREGSIGKLAVYAASEAPPYLDPRPGDVLPLLAKMLHATIASHGCTDVGSAARLPPFDFVGTVEEAVVAARILVGLGKLRLDVDLDGLAWSSYGARGRGFSCGRVGIEWCAGYDFDFWAAWREASALAKRWELQRETFELERAAAAARRKVEDVVAYQARLERRLAELREKAETKS